MEDDLSSFHKAREELIESVGCIQEERTIKRAARLKEIRGKVAGELELDEIELLLGATKYKGEQEQKYLISIGDLGRKDIRHEPVSTRIIHHHITSL